MRSRLRRLRLVHLAWGLVVLLSITVGAYFLLEALDDEESPPPAPTVAVQPKPDADSEPEREAAEELGFPAFATKNTTRVGGVDATADAAGTALATFPSAGGVEGPVAVSLVGASDWQAGIAAAALTSPPLRVPILLGEVDDVPESTATALDALRPQGSAATDDAQLFRIGEVRAPSGLRATDVGGDDPAAIADSLDRLRERLTDAEPRHVLVVAADAPAFAMPAAAWAARSGDPVLFVGKDSVPEPTLEALRRHEDAPAYVLGPKSVVSDKVVAKIGDVAAGVQRISGEDPVTNAIAFARFDDGTFGWNLNDPGHGFAIANAARPLDAAAAAALSGSGKWAPLLLTETADRLPAALRGYLLDVKPGYQDDPTRALYNHAWLLGDQRAIGLGFQAQVDELLELIKVRAGTRAGA